MLFIPALMNRRGGLKKPQLCLRRDFGEVLPAMGVVSHAPRRKHHSGIPAAMARDENHRANLRSRKCIGLIFGWGGTVPAAGFAGVQPCDQRRTSAVRTKPRCRSFGLALAAACQTVAAFTRDPSRSRQGPGSPFTQGTSALAGEANSAMDVK